MEIYDEAKELGEFGKIVTDCKKWASECGDCKFFDYPDNPMHEEGKCHAIRLNNAICPLKIPPKNWCYVEELK